ncbi:hypothetical protein RFI_32393, partial [Reticulomyxa filosa]
ELLDLFRPLCRPEEIVKMKIEEDIRFLSLGTIVETQQKNCKNQMVMVITNDMEHNIPMEWIHCTKKISSFKKIDQFEKTVKEFFNNKISEDVLILQYRYTPSSEYQLEQIIHILQLEHHLFYNDPKNNEEHKIVILLIHNNKRSPFYLIFRQKWKIVYVDYLLSMGTISLQKDLKKSVTNVVDRLLEQVKNYIYNLSKCARGAFGRLHFLHSVDSLKEKQYLSLFEQKEFHRYVEILRRRLQILLSNVADYRSVEDILNKLEKSGKKKMEGSFFERYQSIIDTLLTLTFVNVLFTIYQNGGFVVLFIYFFIVSIKYVESVDRKDEIEYQWYKKLFERALENEELVKMRSVNIDANHLLLAAINPQLYSIRTCLQCSFPFSYSIHSWCQRQLSTNSEAPNNDLILHATELEQISIGNDNLTNWEVDYFLKVIHEYAMDLVRFEFSWRLHTPDQQIMLRNVIVSMALLLCGKLTIATIEVTIHHFHHIIFHYAHLISICSKFAHVKDVPENRPGQWLVQMTLSLWKSISFRKICTTSESILFFPTS